MRTATTLVASIALLGGARAKQMGAPGISGGRLEEGGGGGGGCGGHYGGHYGFAVQTSGRGYADYSSYTQQWSAAAGGGEYGYGYGGGGGSAASAGVAMAVLDSEAAWSALEEGRGGGGGGVQVYMEDPVTGAVHRVPDGRWLGDAAVATAVADAAGRAEAAQAESESVTAEAMAQAAAEAAEEESASDEETQAASTVEEEEGADVAAEDATGDDDDETIAAEGSGDSSGAATHTDSSSCGSSSGVSGGGGADGGLSSSGAEAKTSAAAAGDLLGRVAALKASGRAAADGGNWASALESYQEACGALAEAAEEGEAEGAGEGASAKELLSCRLSAALCALQLQDWEAAVAVCGDALRASPRCAKAHYRRAIALQGLGNVDAALWDLQRAATLQPANERFKGALQKAEETIAARPASHKRPALGGKKGGAVGGDGMDAMMRQMLGSLGSGAAGAPSAGAGAADGLASLFGSAGGADGGMDGLMSLLSGAGGGGGTAAAASDDGVSPLEALLNSPLAAGMGGKGAGKAMGMLSTFLAYQRRAKKIYRMVKPYLPLLFWGVIFLLARPWLLENVVPLLRPHLPAWARACLPNTAGCPTVAA